jgi:enterochelin esterase-like enzyme
MRAMRRLAVQTLALVAAAGIAAPLEAQTARTVRFDSQALGGSQATFAILLPPGYADSDARYPVVYLLHGGTHNHTAFPARAWFGKEVARRGMIAVMPHTPQSIYMARGAGGSMAVVDFLANDLVKYVDATYRTRANRESRAIAGLSMGGFGAVITGLRHPELFGHIGAFSGAFTADREPRIQAAVNNIPDTLLPFVYLACGVSDSALGASRGLAALLTEKKIPHELREVPGGHTWEVWDPQTLAFFDVLARQPAWPGPR